jgi:hypothetical protein
MPIIGSMLLTLTMDRGPPSGRDLLGIAMGNMHESDKLGYWRGLIDENLPSRVWQVRTSDTGWLAPAA